MINATLMSKQIKEQSYSWHPGKFPLEVVLDFGWLRTSGLSPDLSFFSKLGNVTNPGEFFLLLHDIFFEMTAFFVVAYHGISEILNSKHASHFLKYPYLITNICTFLNRNGLIKFLKIFWKLLKILVCLLSFGLLCAYMWKGMCTYFEVDSINCKVYNLTVNL